MFQPCKYPHFDGDGDIFDSVDDDDDNYGKSLYDDDDGDDIALLLFASAHTAQCQMSDGEIFLLLML